MVFKNNIGRDSSGMYPSPEHPKTQEAKFLANDIALVAIVSGAVACAAVHDLFDSIAHKIDTLAYGQDAANAIATGSNQYSTQV